MGEASQEKSEGNPDASSENEAIAWSSSRISFILGVSSRRVQQLADQGIAVRVGHGKYDLVQTVKNYVDFVKAQGQPKDAGAKDLEVEKVRLTKARADEAELRLTILRGDAVMMPDVEDLIAEEYGALRAGLSQISGSVARVLSKTSDPAACQEIVFKAVEGALANLTADQPDGAKPQTRHLPGAEFLDELED
ncbi:hypothetical protein BMI91_19655 [Thioclava sediminum]|uniref:Terminase small subunit n=1 Tax=Thioclava sediminum TaxID=1915319 RepID=A0ABX3MS20_9RHOB|nr:hypothetical protein [Thioclava sediminum]OOY22500.1 hypothetical protein BMI91_19655 [Thioclava sediminum]